MAATLNWNAKTLRMHDGSTLERVSVVVRDNVVTVRPRPGKGEPIVLDGVVSVEATIKNATITFADGKVWSAEKMKGCGCGR